MVLSMSGPGIIHEWTWYYPRVDVVLSKSGHGILRDRQKQIPTPTPTSSSLLRLVRVRVQSQVGVEFDK